MDDSRVGGPLIGVVGRLMSRFGVRDPIASRDRFHPDSRVGPSARFVVIAPVVGVSIISVPIGVRVVRIGRPIKRNRAGRQVGFSALDCQAGVIRIRVWVRRACVIVLGGVVR